MTSVRAQTQTALPRVQYVNYLAIMTLTISRCADVKTWQEQEV